LIGDGVTTVAADATKGADWTSCSRRCSRKRSVGHPRRELGQGEPEELGKITEENFDLL